MSPFNTISPARVSWLLLLLFMLGQQLCGTVADIHSVAHSVENSVAHSVAHTAKHSVVHSVAQNSVHTGLIERTESKVGKFEDKDTTNVDLHDTRTKTLKPDLNLERSKDKLTSNSSRADFPCPSSAAIAPCVCRVDDNNNIDLNCTDVESEEQLAAVFQQEFPVKELHGFYMASNDAIKIIWNIQNGVSFEEIYITPGPFTLQIISDYFLLASRLTLSYLQIDSSHLLSDGFPFAILDDMASLEKLLIHGSNFTWIPKLNSPTIEDLHFVSGSTDTIEPGTFDAVPNLSNLNLYNNFLTELRAGTVPIGEGSTEFIACANEIQVIEPGTFFFRDANSATSSEWIYIDLVSNQIQSLEAGTFLLRYGPTFIYLYDNQIASIEPGTFVIPDPASSEDYGEILISLFDNPLQFLQAGTFPLRNGPVSLYLPSNQIASIEPGTFLLPEATDSFSLVLWLYSNQLTTLDEAVFGDLMPFITDLQLYDNPLTCGCDIAWLVVNPTLMGKVDEDATCADGTNLHDLDPQNFVDNC